MKKTISLLLSILLLIFLFSGCSEANTTSHTLQVGYGRVDITPKDPVSLGGYDNPQNRISDSVTYNLYATCIALTDKNDNTVLLFHLDLLTATQAVLFAKKEVSTATGIPFNQIIAATTHTHSAPALGSDFNNNVEYCKSLKQWMVTAAQEALLDRKSAQVHTATAYPETLNYVRHYVMNDGSIVGDNFGDATGKTYVRHVHDVDNAMQLIKFTREGGKDVLLVNWQGHPHRDGGTTKRNVSSDIVGVLREELESQLDCHFAYFTGASGNVNNHSRIPAERITNTCEEHGKALAEYALRIEEYTQQDLGCVQFMTKSYSVPTSNNTGTMDIPMTVVSIGDICFAVVPYEMFDSNGMELKKASPFNMTFVVTCANGAFGYVPDVKAFEYGGYEVKLCSMAKGSGELLANEYVNMLKELYNTKE